MSAAGCSLLQRWGAARPAPALISLGRPGPESMVAAGGAPVAGAVDFASVDYLSLSAHPLVREAAVAAVDRYGVHAAGAGRSAVLHRLEARLAEALRVADCVVFPTGAVARYAAVRGLVGKTDHVVIDVRAHRGLREGAQAATRFVHVVPDGPAVVRRIRRIRARDALGGILAVTPAVCPDDAGIADTVMLQGACRELGATLLLDVAHDFAAMGDGGGGVLALQGMVGQVDLLVGSFAPALAATGGFVAGHVAGLRPALAGALTGGEALSPVQAAAAEMALEVVRSVEGAARRLRLMANVRRLRAGLAADGFAVCGTPCGVVPVVLGEAVWARAMTQAALSRGGVVRLVEHPSASRWRMQVMADHAPAHVERMVGIAAEARAEAEMRLGK